MDIRKGKLLYEGHTKKIYPTNDPEFLIVHFKNDVIASRESKKETIKNKGAINNAISSVIFQYLESYHVPTHYVEVLKSDEMLVKKLEIIPIIVKVWNFVTGSLNKRFGAEKGSALSNPIVEFYLKDEKLKNPMMTMDHACALGYGNPEEIQNIDRIVRKINAVLKSYFDRRDLKLVDFNIEFGRLGNQILVGDEISLDSCCFYYVEDGEVQNTKLVPQESSDMEAEYEALKNRVCP